MENEYRAQVLKENWDLVIQTDFQTYSSHNEDLILVLGWAVKPIK